jgi:hypothetical protein
MHADRPDAAIHPPQPLPCITDPDPDNLPPGSRFRTTSPLGIHVCKGFHASRISALFTLLDAMYICPIATAVTVRYISCPLQRHPLGPTDPLSPCLQRNKHAFEPRSRDTSSLSTTVLLGRRGEQKRLKASVLRIQPCCCRWYTVSFVASLDVEACHFNTSTSAVRYLFGRGEGGGHVSAARSRSRCACIYVFVGLMQA